MASPGTSPPSIRQGVRIVPPENDISVEEVLLAVGEQVGHDKLCFASRMNKAVVVFLNEEIQVYQLIESGLIIRDGFVQVSPLSVPSTWITVSGVPSFISNKLLQSELRRFGKFASGFRTLNLGCKNPKLKHVQSLRRQAFMLLDSPTNTLEVSFRVKYGDGHYMVYASSGSLKCFECGDVGHKRFSCPHKQRPDEVAGDGSGAKAAAAHAEAADASSAEAAAAPSGGGAGDAPSARAAESAPTEPADAPRAKSNCVRVMNGSDAVNEAVSAATVSQPGNEYSEGQSQSQSMKLRVSEDVENCAVCSC